MSAPKSDLKILALSGSFRAASLNTALLRAAQTVAPEGVKVEIYNYRDIPLYDDDLPEVPESVLRLKRAITEADGVLLAVPEYNYSVPGVLKNAVDWASRPAYHSPFRDTPVGVLSVTGSPVGGARGQQHMKTILLGMAAAVFPWPEFMVGNAGSKFTDGVLTDEQVHDRLVKYMAGFANWAGKLSR
ncbi:MAG: NADPH-dependent FMN reductase [Bradymonadia bacterium]